MKIAQSPYSIQIVPHSATAPNLWRCTVAREGPGGVIFQQDTVRKEDARALALAELVRLQQAISASMKRFSAE